MPTNVLRHLPSVSELLESPPLKTLFNKVSHNVVVSRVRSALDDLRHELRTAASDMQAPNVSELAERIARHILQADQLGKRAVINASGVLLDASLGFAPLAEDVVTEVAALGRGYTNLEFDLPSGKPAPRAEAAESLAVELSGAEAALITSTHAGAALLALTALAAGREVIVSRGQLIEAAGGGRLPELIAASGAVSREVGSTNRTLADDYAAAIGERTAAILHVRLSNCAVVGSVAEVGLAELVEVARSRHLPVIHDIGLGSLVELKELGSPQEPTAAGSLAQGTDLVIARGDGLLGGPQCGILLGKRKLIELAARHPLAGALAADKLTLAALTATLRLYRTPSQALRAIPLLGLLNTPAENLQLRAERLAPQMAESSVLKAAIAAPSTAHLSEAKLECQRLSSSCIALEPAEMSAERLAERLRTGRTAVVGRVENNRVELDLRAVLPRQDQELVAAVLALAERTA